jgi:hypothetical protein
VPVPRRAGERFPLPDGVTPELLKKYADVAERAIQQGMDTLGVQQLRHMRLSHVPM